MLVGQRETFGSRFLGAERGFGAIRFGPNRGEHRFPVSIGNVLAVATERVHGGKVSQDGVHSFSGNGLEAVTGVGVGCLSSGGSGVGGRRSISWRLRSQGWCSFRVPFVSPMLLERLDRLGLPR